mgnify:CR=1 FL=1
MATPVVTVLSGGLPVTESNIGLAVTEAPSGGSVTPKGIPVTKVPSGGLPVKYVTDPIVP